MKFKIHVHAAGLCLMLFACFAMGLMAPVASTAQSEPPLLGGAPEFDWSDYRGTAKGRLFLAKLSSVSISGSRNGTSFDSEIVGPYLSNDVQLFKELIATFYVDRLGLRICAEEATVEGRHEALVSSTSDSPRYPQLDIGPTRLGFDLDIIRYPFVKLGCNLDYGLHGVRLKHLKVTNPNVTDAIEQAEWRSDGPLTIGLHAQAIPFRLKEVPAIFMGRVRAPVPFLEQVASSVGLKQLAEIAKVKVVDWEVSAGLRPAVWETSCLGHSTFSFAVELGYRSYSIDTPLRGLHLPEVSPSPYAQKLDMRAHWQGAFFQAAVFY